MLSKVGKVTFIKYVAMVMPIYTMLTFRVPKGLCKEMDALVRRFWRGTKKNFTWYMALLSWSKICKLKSREG